jgi:phosphatidylserine decarboxylase
MKIAQGGISWLISSFFVTLFLFILSLYTNNFARFFVIFLFAISLLIFFILCIFFRDPERKTGKGIVAVADGVVREIASKDDKDIGKCTMISTFMNIHNVHVNRMPIDGVIKKISYYKGTHIPAFKKESEKNERIKILIKSERELFKIILIAGTLARRIVPYIHQGDKINKGEKIALIRLGSRVDVFLPENIIKSINVKMHDKLKAGEDTIAETYD